MCLLAWATLIAGPCDVARGQTSLGDRLKDSLEIRLAFEPVIANARRATVQILIDGKQVALGAVVDRDGYVITKASQLIGPAVCRLDDGRTFPAEVVGVEQDYDLAMLKIDAEKLPELRWDERGDPRVGQWLASVGASELPLAIGVISVLSRPIPPERGVLGVSISQTRVGSRINEVFPQSGADQAGVKTGDTVTHVGEVALRSGLSLADAIGKLRPGDRVSLRISRGDETLVVQARLGASVSGLHSRADLERQLGGELSIRRAGFPAALQHDSVLRPTECGGPIVGLSGRAVGINIARAGRAESYAIPAGAVLGLLSDLKSGKLSQPALAAASDLAAPDSGRGNPSSGGLPQTLK